jgi:hypothetical protein
MKKLISIEMTQQIKDTLKGLPKEKDWDDDEYFPTYELMIYTTYEEGKYDFHEFHHFKGIRQLEKAIREIINQYKETLYCIDFKYSHEEGEFDQFTIYTHNN